MNQTIKKKISPLSSGAPRLAVTLATRPGDHHAPGPEMGSHVVVMFRRISVLHLSFLSAPPPHGLKNTPSWSFPLRHQAGPG